MHFSPRKTFVFTFEWKVSIGNCLHVTTNECVFYLLKALKWPKQKGDTLYRTRAVSHYTRRDSLQAHHCRDEVVHCALLRLPHFGVIYFPAVIVFFLRKLHPRCGRLQRRASPSDRRTATLLGSTSGKKEAIKGQFHDFVYVGYLVRHSILRLGLLRSSAPMLPRRSRRFRGSGEKQDLGWHLRRGRASGLGRHGVRRIVFAHRRMVSGGRIRILGK